MEGHDDGRPDPAGQPDPDDDTLEFRSGQLPRRSQPSPRYGPGHDAADRPADRPTPRPRWSAPHWPTAIGIGVGLVALFAGIMSATVAGLDAFRHHGRTTGPAASSLSRPSPAAARGELLRLTGSGIRSTAQFRTTGAFDVGYTFDCSGQFGGKGTFAVFAMATDGRQVVVANDLSTGRTNAAHVDARAGTWHLQIASGCRWTVQVHG